MDLLKKSLANKQAGAEPKRKAAGSRGPRKTERQRSGRRAASAGEREKG